MTAGRSPEAALTPGPLHGWRILELGQLVSAPLCTRVLAGFGADVIKIEPRDGDPARRYGSRSVGAAREAAPLFLDLNVGKRGITLALDDPGDRERFLRLVARADVLVENYPVGHLDSLALGYPRLAEVNPGLVLASISPFGQTGPHSRWRAHDLNCAATGAYCLKLGTQGREPLNIPPNSMESLAGLHAAGAVLAALVGRAGTRRGQLIDIAVAEAAACVFEGMEVMAYVQHGRHTERSGYRGPANFPHAILPCADGYVAVVAGQPDMWARFVELMGDPAWTEDPRFQQRSIVGRDHPDEGYDLIASWLRRSTKADLLALGIANHLPFGPVRRIDEVLGDEQLEHRSFFFQLEREHVGPLRYAGSASVLGGTPWTVDRPAPTLGQHNEEVFRELVPGATRAAINDDGVISASGAERRAPLAGIRVVDFGHIVAGPMVGAFLADLGAQVLKVESRTRLDSMRRPVNDGEPRTPAEGIDTGANPRFQGLNRGKLSLTVNFKDERGRRLLLRLVQASDIVIDNFSAGVLERVGLGYRALVAVRPEIIQLSISGAGQSGPLAHIVAYGPVMTALSGHSSLVGYPGERPLNIGNFGDSVAAVNAVVAILAALVARERGGTGQFIDLSAYAASAGLLGELFLRYQLTGEVPATQGNSHPDLAPHGIYPCAPGGSAERWVAIVVADQAEWTAFAVLAGLGWEREARFGDLAARLRHREELDRAIGLWTKSRRRDELVELLQGIGIAATPVNDIDEMYRDPHWRMRGTFPTVHHPKLGEVQVPRVPWHFSRSVIGPQGPAPLLGEHSERICREILGMSEEEIADVRDALT